MDKGAGVKRRVWILALILLVLICVVVGCTSDHKTSNSSAATSTVQPTTKPPAQPTKTTPPAATTTVPTPPPPTPATPPPTSSAVAATVPASPPAAATTGTPTPPTAVTTPAVTHTTEPATQQPDAASKAETANSAEVSAALPNDIPLAVCPGTTFRILTGNTAPVWATAFSPDSHELASGSIDGSIKLWDMRTGSFAGALQGQTSPVRSLAFSSDGMVLAAGSDDGVIRLWNVGSPAGYAAAFPSNPYKVLPGHSDAVCSIAFSHDGALLASGSADGTIRLRNATTGEDIRTLEGHSWGVTCVAFSSDGRLLASASLDKRIMVWDVATGTCVHTLSGHTGSVQSVAFDPSGTYLASGSTDHTAVLWWVTDGTPVRSFEGHDDEVSSVAFTPDGKVLVSASVDARIMCWDVASGGLIRTFPGHAGPIRSIAISGDGRLLASGSEDKTIRVWDLPSECLAYSVAGHVGEVKIITWTQNGSRVVTGSADGTVKLWDASTGECLRSLAHDRPLEGLALGGPGDRLIVSGTSDGAVRLWDGTTGVLVCTLRPPAGDEAAVAVTADGKILAISSSGGLELWSLETRQKIRSLKDQSLGRVSAVAFSPDARFAASGSSDGQLQVWDVAAGTIGRTLEGHTGPVTSVAFSHNGRLLASGSYNEGIMIWDASTGALLRTISDVWVYSGLTFSPDDKYVACSIGAEVRVWHIATGSTIRTVTNASAAAFSPDGMYIACGMTYGAIQFWETTTEKLARTTAAHTGPVNCLLFTPDAKLLLSGSIDGSVRVWDSATRESIAVLVPEYGSGVVPGRVWIYEIALSPDGTIAATAGNNNLLYWALGPRRFLGRGTALCDEPHLVGFCADEKTLVVFSAHTSPSSGAPTIDLRGCQDGLWSGPSIYIHGLTSYAQISLSPDGRLLACALDDGTLELWNVLTQVRIGRYEPSECAFHATAFSPDGRWLACETRTGQLGLWDVSDAKLVRSFEGACRKSSSQVVFSPDGALVAAYTAAGLPGVWDTGTGRLIRTLAAEMGTSTRLVFSPDSRFLATEFVVVVAGEVDRMLTLWNAVTGDSVVTLATESAIHSIQFSPDGRLLVFALEDGSILFWNLREILGLRGELTESPQSAQAAGLSVLPSQSAPSASPATTTTRPATTSSTTTTGPSTTPTRTSPVTPAPPTTTTPTTTTTPVHPTTTTPTVPSTSPGGSSVANADPCATSTGEAPAEYTWTYQLLPRTLSATIPAGLLCRSETADLPRARKGFPYSQLADLVTWKGDDSFLAQLARDINRGYADYYEIATNTLHFVQALMPYTRDIGDYWQLPVETLARQNGDCEDGAVLYVALMQSMGYSDSVRIGVYEGHVFGLVEVTSDWKTKIETLCPNKCLDLLSDNWTVVQSADKRLWALAETTVDPSWQTLGYTGLGCGRIPEASWANGKVAMLAPDTGQSISLVDVSSDEKLLRLWRFLLPDELLPSSGSD